MAVIAFTTIGFGLLLGWADQRQRGVKTVDQITWRSALIVGAAQALALIPGTSRSGVTMTAALALGFDRTTAARLLIFTVYPYYRPERWYTKVLSYWCRQRCPGLRFWLATSIICTHGLSLYP